MNTTTFDGEVTSTGAIAYNPIALAEERVAVCAASPGVWLGNNENNVPQTIS